MNFLFRMPALSQVAELYLDLNEANPRRPISKVERRERNADRKRSRKAKQKSRALSRTHRR